MAMEQGENREQSLPLKENVELLCDDGSTIKIKGLLDTTGMRGTIYIANKPELGDDELFVLKLPNIDESKSEKEVVNRINVLNADMLNEINAWDRLERDPEAKNLFSVIVGSGRIQVRLKERKRFLGFVIQKYINGVSLSKWCVQYFGEPSPDGNGMVFKGINEAKMWFDISRKIVNLIRASHDQRVIHGDIWPPNIMMKMSGESGKSEVQPVLIDFGRAWLLDQDFDLRGEDKTRFPFYAPELWNKEGKTWYAPADIYSLGGILYFLATGSPPPSPYRGNLGHEILNNLTERELKSRTKSNTELKQEIVSGLIQINLKLYSKNPGIADIIHYCLRTRVEERAQHAYAVLEVIDLFQNAYNKSIVATQSFQEGERPHLDTSDLLNRFLTNISAIENQLFRNLIAQRVQSLQSQFASAGTRLYNITGDRESIVNSFLTCLSCLQNGDQCLAVTTPIFWRRRNFGANGRFLTMLKLAALNGITIRWVILVSKADLKDESVKTIMQAQCNAVIELANNTYRIAGHPSVSVNDKALNGNGYYVGWALQPDDEYETYLRQARTFICINKRISESDRYTLFAPAYSERGGGTISIIRCWADSPRWKEEFKDILSGLLEKSNNVCQYPGVTPDVNEFLNKNETSE